MDFIARLARMACLIALMGLLLHSRTASALPDLIVQDGVFNLDIVTRYFETNDCTVLEDCAQPGLRRLLRLNTENRNIGTTDLVLGNPVGNTNFVFDSCHDHYHFDGYADYRLVNSNGVVAAGHKEGFCLEDVNRFDDTAGLNAKYDCSNQGIQAGWADVYSQFLDCQWIDITDVEPGTYTLEVEVNPEHRIVESNYSNNVTSTQVEIPAFPTIDIESPSNGSVGSNRLITVSGTADSQNGLVSVVVTNNRGGTVTAILTGTNWTANNVSLRVGTNFLFAVVTDTLSNAASDSVTVIRVNTNYVDTTLRTTKVSLALGTAANSDSLTFSGVLGQAISQFDPVNDSLEVMFGDLDATLAPNQIVNGRFRGVVSSSNNLTSVKLDLAKRTISFSAAGIALTNLDPFQITLTLGTNQFGPDRISFPVPAVRPGKSKWAYGKPLPDVDQFFVTKGTLTIDTFNFTGTLNAHTKPNVLANDVTFGIGSYEETLLDGGWAKGSGNSHSYKPPTNADGAVQSMKLDFDKGTWSASGAGADLSFLFGVPTTEIRLEVEDFAASLTLSFTVNGAKFVY
ncbi:MAG: hypothetical protein EXS18_06905 [Verrucomicrobiae bacterium]|nr:hypothetical protein [Verrucomicrobiae bacterium]